jgi:zinc protease
MVGGLLLALTVSACATAGREAAPVPATPAPVRHVLSNGMRVIVQEHRASDVVALQLWVRAGGRDEAASELGLAHYLEHMLFKGTVSRPPGFVEREVESVGGRINAGTSLDFTFYHAVLPAARATAGIQMLADVAVNAALDAALLDAEKQVVLEEMRLGEDNPRRLLARRIYAMLFDGHAYGRPVIGTPELIRGLSRNTLLAFYRRHYVPEAFTLVVVGAVDTDAVLAAAREGFAPIPRGGVERLPLGSPPPVRAQRVDLERPGGQAYLGLAWRGPRLDHADTPAVELLAAVLGHSRSARLPRRLRDGLGLVDSIGASYTALQTAGAITITAQLDRANLNAAEQEILKEVKRIADEGITAAERRRAITAGEAQHEFAAETAEGRARTLGRADTVWRLEDEAAWLDRLRSVSTEQIRAVARRYLDTDRFVRLALVPPGIQ